MKKELIEVYLESKGQHLNQLIAGLFDFSKKEHYKVIYLKKQKQNSIKLPCKNSAIVYFRTRKIIFDMSDGYNFYSDFSLSKCLQEVDFYFKRSFSSDINKTLVKNDLLNKKIFPYGFNYDVRKKPTFLQLIKNISFEFCYKLRHPSYKISYCNYVENDFICLPKSKIQNPKIIFYTRLWNPDDDIQDRRSELKKINETRIGIIRALSKKYKESFFGGIFYDKFSSKVCQDIVLSRSITGRFQYLKTLKKCDICIGSIGLHNSIGWKTGEYIAASKAIINEKLFYEVTGNFEVGRNYLEYTTIKECVKMVDYLVNNKDEIIKMSNNNKVYYDNFLSPYCLIRNAFKVSGVLLK